MRKRSPTNNQQKKLSNAMFALGVFIAAAAASAAAAAG
jgi:hypothetical protein